ncbi:MAG: hypothetical protein ACFFCK_04005 [Promethearchaeota archaeon]
MSKEIDFCTKSFPGLTPWADDVEIWDYILNKKHPDPSIYEIQWAIWYFSDDGVVILDVYPHTFEMVEDALANGEGFQPECNQFGAIIFAREAVQKTLKEVDP